MSPPDYYRRRYEERRAWAIEMLGSQCSECGTTLDLQIHHRDPSQKSVRISTVLSRWSIAKISEELAKCILLCADCHTKHHHPNAGAHGIPARYNAGCRCKPCTKANTKRARKYRAKKR